MSNEQAYDDHIAPKLLEVAKLCEQMGMSIVARVEWAPDEAGITHAGVGPQSGVGQRLTQIAAHARGNIDLICIEAMRRFDCSRSMVLRMLQAGQGK